MKDASRFVPWVVAGIGALFLGFAAIPRRDREADFHLHEFGQLPVVHRGRVQPLDTFARVALMTVSGHQSYKDGKDGKGATQPAVRWLLEVMTSSPKLFKNGGKAIDLEVFRIENDQVLDMLGLKMKPGWYRYSIDQFAANLGKLEEAAYRADKKDAKKRDIFDVKALQLMEHLGVYKSIATWSAPFAIPPAQGEDWKPLGQSFVEVQMHRQDNANARAFATMLMAYSEGEVETFNRALADYSKRLDRQLPAESGKAGFETFFNNFAPFYMCMWLYVFVFLMACVSWLAWPQVLNRSAFWLAVVAVVVHTWALLARMYLSGRPLVFVTNLYSSAVFIGWMSVVLGLILERIYHNGIGNALAGLTGALSLFVANHLGSDGDTLEMLQAVLDTNFWLATHVTAITIGYAATFGAGFLGIAYIVMGIFTTELTGELRKTLTQMIYGVVCFATLFSFTGTVLGGIWADQSWGRFWGWDPKENGALLIVLWNALVLHARWGGLIKQRGLAVLVVVGNMVTGWSWFGTNQLGVGLHAYGFNNTLAMGLTVFWFTQLLCIGLGSLVPLQAWRSFAPPASGGPTVLALATPGAPPVPRGGRDDRDVPPTGIKRR